MLGLLILVVVGIPAFYGIANEWGERRFDAEVLSLKAAGLPVSLDDAFGPPPPAAEDVFEHPTFKSEMAKDEITRFTSLDVPGISKTERLWKPEPARGKVSDVRQLADPPRPDDPEPEVARALLVKAQPLSDRFDLAMEGLGRPTANLHPGRHNVMTIPFPSVKLLGFCGFAGDRARLRLAAGDAEGAYQDGLRIIDLENLIARNRPLLIDGLLIRTIEWSVQSVIWEGIARHGWTDSQLTDLQTNLSRIDLCQVAISAARTEIAFGITFTREATDRPGHFKDVQAWPDLGKNLWEKIRDRDMSGVNGALGEVWYKVRPWGVDLEVAARQFEGMAKDGLDLRPDGHFTADDYEKFQRVGGEFAPGRFEAVGGMALMNIAKISVEGETQRSLLKCGIALERYRLKHGETPDRLDVLVPEFLPAVPRDISDGQPLRYQRLPDGAPHIWSIWPSGRDESGMPNAQKTHNSVWTTGQIPGLTDAVYRRP